MAHLQKYSAMQEIGHLCAHYERTVPSGHYSNKDIHEEKIIDDYNLAPERGVQTEYIKGKIKEITTEKKLRKDAVRMACWIVNAPSSLPEERKTEFSVHFRKCTGRCPALWDTFPSFFCYLQHDVNFYCICSVLRKNSGS